MRILYVEDNPANLFLVKRVAKMGNHEVVNYIDGAEVLKKFDRIQPDMVLMDIQLASEMSGLDVVRELRAQGHQIPIIAVTAYAMVGDREHCLEAGCDDYLPKPLPIPQLVELFDRYDPTRRTAQTDDTAAPAAPKPAVSSDPPSAPATRLSVHSSGTSNGTGGDHDSTPGGEKPSGGQAGRDEDTGDTPTAHTSD